MPLSMASTGAAHDIKEIRGQDDTKRFLSSLGFLVGREVTVVSEAGGNLIVSVLDARIAISRSMASRIIVS